MAGTGKLPRKTSYAVGPPSENRGKESGGIYTHNGNIIDLVLTFKPLKHNVSQQEYRMKFEEKMWQSGLQLDYQGISESPDGKTCFIKIHGPWETLALRAELNRIHVPIQKSDLQENELREKEKDEEESEESEEELEERDDFNICSGRALFSLEPEIRPPRTSFYFSLEFSRDRMRYFLNQDRDTFFTQNQRIQLVWDIVRQINISSHELSGPLLGGHQSGETVGLDFLLDAKVFKAVFPLHDANVPKPEEPRATRPWPLRPWLYEAWARPGRWRYSQPLGKIREYFGESVGMYFAWLGLHTAMLVPLSIFGLFCFCYGLAIAHTDDFVLEVCDKQRSGHIIICRSCVSETCKFKTLFKSCPYAISTVVFHNNSTVFLALFTCLWAIVFLEFWKRKQNRLACKWDTFDLGYEYEPPRPQYQAMAREKRRNPITRQWEPYIGARSRAQKLVFSCATVSFFISVAVAVIVGVILFRMIMVVNFYLWRDRIPFVEQLGSEMITNTIGSALNACCILLLEQIYEKLAWRLTENECPRTMKDFERSFTFKMYTFQFINYYAFLFYLAFAQKHIAGIPRAGSSFADRCEPVGCTFSVTTQLIVVLVVKQVYNNFSTIALPKLQKCWERHRRIRPGKINNRYEKDNELPRLPALYLFPDYLEIVIQYGFVVLFGAAFPLAPLIALINNIVEMRVHAHKFLIGYRRPIPVRVSNIGNWYEILKFLTSFSVFTNALLIAFTTDLLDRFYFDQFVDRKAFPNYVEFSFSIFDTSEWPEHLRINTAVSNDSTCRFRGHFNPPSHEKRYHHSLDWYKIVVIKITFVVLFQNLIGWVQSLLQYLIPDIPEDVSLHIQRNRYVTKVATEKFHRESENKENQTRKQ